MKNNITVRLLLIVAALSTSFIGCKKSSRSGNSSRGTGWQINAKEGGFQYNTNFKDQETAPGLVFVEGGTYTMGKVQDDVNVFIRLLTIILKNYMLAQSLILWSGETV